MTTEVPVLYWDIPTLPLPPSPNTPYISGRQKLYLRASLLNYGITIFASA
jgi:hypothetical protein